jgi:multicomponent Na+:H+ antiporter subunit G
VSAATWIATALVVVGLVATTAAVIGVLRLRDTFARIHSASLAVGTGAVPVLLACAFTQPAATGARAVLVAVCVLLTAPIGSHALARLRHARDLAELDGTAPSAGARTEARA